VTTLTGSVLRAAEMPEFRPHLIRSIVRPVSDWIQSPGTQPLDIVRPVSWSVAPEQPRFQLDNTPGTLFRWSYGGATGGPDLDAPLATDRPDFTEASSTVGRGIAQLEFGYTFTENRDGGDSEQSHSFGEPLLRYGVLANWLEFRVAVFPVQTATTVSGVSSRTGGTEDTYLGFKIGLTPQDGCLPEMAVMPQMTIPTGSNAFTDGEVLPGLNWLCTWELTDNISIAGNTQLNRALDDTGESYIEIAQSAACALGLTDELGAYAEWYAFFPSGAGNVPVEHYFNGGFTWLFNNDVQWDIRAGTGLTGASDDFFVGTGFSIRFQ